MAIIQASFLVGLGNGHHHPGKMLDLLGIYQTDGNTALMKQVQQQKAVITGGFHDAMMLNDRECSDELANSCGSVRVSLGTVAVH